MLCTVGFTQNGEVLSWLAVTREIREYLEVTVLVRIILKNVCPEMCNFQNVYMLMNTLQILLWSFNLSCTGNSVEYHETYIALLFTEKNVRGIKTDKFDNNREFILKIDVVWIAQAVHHET